MARSISRHHGMAVIMKSMARGSDLRDYLEGKDET